MQERAFARFEQALYTERDSRVSSARPQRTCWAMEVPPHSQFFYSDRHVMKLQMDLRIYGVRESSTLKTD